MKKAICLMALLCLILSSRAQFAIQPLAIGDSVPDMPFEYFSESRPAGNFADLRDQFVIFDFWGPFCLPCVKALPLLDSLQQEFTSLRIVLVCDDRRSVEKFYARKKEPMPWLDRLPGIVNDSTLKRLFSVKTVPTYVWVRKGVLWNITGSDALTADRIKAFITP